MVKRAKKKKNKSNKIVITEKTLKRVKNEVAEEAVTKVGMLYLVALAEKGWTEDELAELFETISRYTHYLDEKMVKIQQVQEIIERRTGIIVKGKW